MSSDKHSKTEKPTAKRKREARRDGNVAKSPEIGTWISILAARGPSVPAARVTVGRAAGEQRYSTRA